MNSEAYFQIGNIFKAHGLKGDVSVFLNSEAPLNFDAIEVIFFQQNNQMVPYFIEALSIKADKAYVKFEDVDNKEAAEALKGTKLYLPISQRENLPEGEFYKDELIGLVVTDKNAGQLGSVVDLEQSGLAKLMVVDYKGKELLIPMNSPLITKIDTIQKTISVTLPEGYLDL